MRKVSPSILEMIDFFSSSKKIIQKNFWVGQLHISPPIFSSIVFIQYN